MLQTDVAKQVVRAKQICQRIAKLHRATSKVPEKYGKQSVGKLERRSGFM